MAKELDELKKIVTGILVSSPLRLTISNIDRDYAELVGERIPFRKLGFVSLDGCLNSMKDILEVIGTGPHAEVVLHVSDKSSHINELVTRQKTTKPKRNYGFRSRPLRFRQRTMAHSSHNYHNPVPLMSLQFSQRSNNFSTGKYTTANCEFRPVSNSKVNDNKHTVENKASSSVLNCSNAIKENKNPIQSEPTTYTGTIPKQTISHRLNESIDTDNFDTDSIIYSSDTDDENDIPTQNVNYITQEHIDDFHVGTGIDFASTHNYSNNIPLTVQNDLRRLIAEHDDGIWCGALPQIYKKMFKKELDYLEFGYRSLISMCMELSDIFYCIRPDTGDFKLYNKQKELPSDYNKSIKISQMFRYFKDVSDKPSTEPAVIDIENEVRSSFHYPENVVELYEEIPRQFIPDNIKENDYIEVDVGEVYDPSKFWLLLNDFSDQLNVLMDEMQTFYRSIDGDYKIPEHMITVGLYCVAEYNKECHRAIIVKTIESLKNKVRVYYIDYGTVASVQSNTLKFLHRNFAELPQQAIRARLASIYPPVEKSQWSCEAASRFLQLVTMKTLVAHIHRIDVKRQIIEVFLVDTSSEDDIYMNDTLVEEGYAIFTNQEQEKITLEPEATPWVQHIHFFPTFVEIENSAVPNSDETIWLQQSGMPLEQIYSRYFGQENRQADVSCYDLIDLESVDEDIYDHKENVLVNNHDSKENSSELLNISNSETDNSVIDTSVFDSTEDEFLTPKLPCIKPPPGYNGITWSQSQYNPTPQLHQHNVFPNVATTDYVPAGMHDFAFLQQQQQQVYFPPAFSSTPNYYNPYPSGLNAMFQNERATLQDMIYKILVGNSHAQLNLTQYLVQQEQWQHTLAPNEIYTYLSAILNTLTPILEYQKYCLFRKILQVLTNQQIIDIIERLSKLPSEMYQRYDNTNINSVSNLLHQLNINNSENFTNISNTLSSKQENFDNDCNKQIDSLQKNQRLVVETDLNNKKIHVIWYCKQVHVNVEEIIQIISNKIPIETIRKHIVMIDPTISIIDLPLSNHQHLFEEMSRFKNIDKHTVLHIVPVASIQKVLIYLGSPLDVSPFLAKVSAYTDLWFKSFTVVTTDLYLYNTK